MRVKIVSDGTPHNTKVLNLVTGEMLANVVSVEVWISAEGTKTILTLLDIPIDIEADAEIEQKTA